MSRTSYAYIHQKCSVSADPFRAKVLSRSFLAILPDFCHEIQTDADLTGEVNKWSKIQLKTLENCPPLLLFLRRLEVPGTVSDYKKQTNTEAEIKTSAYMISVKYTSKLETESTFIPLGLAADWKMYKYL